MYAAITLLISVCFAATATIYLLIYFKEKRRKSDLWLSCIGYSLAATYALYTFEKVSPVIYRIEVIVDVLIGVILLWNLRKLVKFTFLERPNAGDN